MRTIDWVDGEIHLIDQTRLPDELVVLRISELDELIDAIARLAVRGAPALGVAGGFGVALLAARHPDDEGAVRAGAQRLRDARPTAVNLAWGVDRALALPAGRAGRRALRGRCGSATRTSRPARPWRRAAPT